MTKRILATVAAVFFLGVGSASAQKQELPSVGEVMIDWPLVGFQSNSEFFHGAFIGVGTHVTLIKFGTKVVAGPGIAFTFTGEKRMAPTQNKSYDWIGRPALAFTVPVSFKCDYIGCLTITPLYEFRRFKWTPDYVDTESRSFGVAVNLSYRFGYQ